MGQKSETSGLSPAAEEIFRKARIYYFERRYEDALREAQRLLSFDDAGARAYSIRALCLIELGMAVEGLAAAEAAVGADREDPVAYSIRAYCRHRLKDNAGAEEDFRRALELGPDNYRTYYNFACYWAQRGEEGLCRENLGRAVALVPPGTAIYLGGEADFARYKTAEWFRELLLAAKGKELKA